MLCIKAGISGNHTNHSLRATTVTRGLENEIPQKCLMARTGHRSLEALQEYERESDVMKLRICEAIHNDKPIWEIEEPMKKQVKTEYEERGDEKLEVDASMEKDKLAWKPDELKENETDK